MEKINPVAESPLDAFRGRRPIVQVIEMFKGKRCWRVKVNCVFCNREHLHGAGETNAFPNLGQRRAHCSKGSYFIVNPRPVSAVVQLEGGLVDCPDSLSLWVQ